MVAKQNLTVYQGADFRRALEFRDNSSTLMDLTGYVFRGQVRKSYSDAEPVMTFEFTLRDQTTSPGLVDMVLPAEESAAVNIAKETSYIYDLEMVDTNLITRRILEGSLRLFPEVTK